MSAIRRRRVLHTCLKDSEGIVLMLLDRSISGPRVKSRCYLPTLPALKYFHSLNQLSLLFWDCTTAMEDNNTILGKDTFYFKELQRHVTFIPLQALKYFSDWIKDPGGLPIFFMNIQNIQGGSQLKHKHNNIFSVSYIKKVN